MSGAPAPGAPAASAAAAGVDQQALFRTLARRRLWGRVAVAMVVLYGIASLFVFQVLAWREGFPYVGWGAPFQRDGSFFLRAVEAMVAWGDPAQPRDEGWVNFAAWPHAQIWRAVLDTLIIAYCGTLLAAATALPLSFVAARAPLGQRWIGYGLMVSALVLLAAALGGWLGGLGLVLALALLWLCLRGRVLAWAAADAARRERLAARGAAAGALARHSVRLVFHILRGVDALIWALVFIRAFGLGPIAGILAIWLTDAGALGKLFAEAIENIDGRQPDGVRSTGAPAAAVVRFGYLPQLMPVLLSQVLYFFESNVRSATIIGAVGAGGVGLLISERIRATVWDQTLYIVLAVLAIVFVIDRVSGWLRLRIIGGPASRAVHKALARA